MKILVVYYSGTNVTKSVARTISKTIGADVEEINDFENRNGLTGYIRSRYEAVFDRLTKISDIKSKIDDYELIVVGTPVWAGKPSTPVTTFIKKYGSRINSLAVFITHMEENRNYKKVIEFIEKSAGKKCVKSLSVSSGIVKKADYYDVISFANELNRL